MDLDPWYITLFLGVVIPILTGFLTKSSASAAVKGFVTLTLAILGTSLATLVSDASTLGGVHLGVEWVREFVFVWGTAIVSYYGLTKYTLAGAAQKATAQVGLGGTLPVIDVENRPASPTV